MADVPSTRPDAVEFTGTPLREFKGKFHNCMFKEEYSNMHGYLQFADIEVLTTKQAYAFPTAELKIKFNKKDRSSWGVLMASVTNVGYEDLLDMKEVRMHMKATERKVVKADEETGDTETIEWLDWRIIGVDGAESKGVAATVAIEDMEAHILDLAMGKTQGEFSNAAMQDDAIRGNSEMSKLVFDGTLLVEYIESGKLILNDEKRYERVDA